MAGQEMSEKGGHVSPAKKSQRNQRGREEEKVGRETHGVAVRE